MQLLTGPALVLASRSAARAAMLEQAGLAFSTDAAVVDEASVREALQAEGAAAEDGATILAAMKAELVARRQPGEAIVIGADQLLELDGRWLEKPGSREAAREQLLALRGREHRLVSAAVAFRGGQRVWHHVASARLFVRPFSDEFLDAYLDAADPSVFRSVGAYHLEGTGAQLMARVDGDYFTVLVMPLLPLLQFLRDQGVLAR